MTSSVLSVPNVQVTHVALNRVRIALSVNTTPDDLSEYGASLTFEIVKVNVSLAGDEEPSVAVTLTLISPTLAFSGVPENVSVEASKLSQEGKAESSASVAE